MDLKKKLLFSFIIIFHLFSLLALPMQHRNFAYKKNSLVEIYSSTLGMIAQWSFFAPEAAEAPLYFDWEIISDNGDLIEKGSWPESIEKVVFKDLMNRQVIMSHFIFNNNSLISKMFVPYLCHKTAHAKKVRLWKESVPPPSLRELLEKGSNQPLTWNGQNARVLVTDSFCKEWL